MPDALSLLFGVHAHQPIGNFPEVVDDAVTRCYHPFLQVLDRYPDFVFAFHSSGWLLGYLAERHPQTMELLRSMVARGQVELVGAGDTEPVLAAIPYIDRIEQLQSMSHRLQEEFGQRPEGAWLTERVWDPSVVPALVDSAIRYVVVDDYHFLCAGLERDELGSFYRTEENGQSIDVFPISEALRYRLPFSEVADAIAFLHALGAQQPGSAAIYFDDIEKFGLWPETYNWVYERGWLAQFIEGVLALESIKTQHFAAYRKTRRPRGMIYLPTVSYSEMNEWTLSPNVAREYERFLQQERDAGRLDARKALIRGGIWKGFLHRYPESNWMHKRMLQLSARFHALPKRRQSEALRADLHAAQANDAYWHGLFGGIYLPHLRRAVHHHLTRLEAGLDQVRKRPAMIWEDVDLDGREECFYHDAQMQIVLHLPYASIQEWNHYPSEHDFADTLARRDEAYYDKIRQGEGAAESENAGGIASAHDRVSFKTVIHADDLLFDDLPCQSFVDHLGGEALHYQAIAEAKTPRFLARHETWELEKSFALRNGCLSVRYAGKATKDAATTFSTRIYLAMPSCDGPAGCLSVDGAVVGGFAAELSGTAQKFRLDDAVLGGSVEILLPGKTAWRAWPHRTVSQSEAGFEKIMQAWVLELTWSAFGEEFSASLQIQVGRA
ncbi:alpha-amylase/4-alpha-glucanotransferase domain-containing protein [Acidithiobacillus sp. AMEEHan]|uniref:alpha-amylase/4-alpha-glucanotransferase domain-containing protein n=1 Tax=Acidithiobacillus sp. AMEEHan TaxID=2994951 RepID=UPI0027E5617D|nr:alpha-amylase/4-alpha-glucanotransferase domain-containing protein [Acidithiobacillus sp. AMEEHan]